MWIFMKNPHSTYEISTILLVSIYDLRKIHTQLMKYPHLI